MSFEVIFHYYDKDEENKNYKIDDPKTFSKQLGKKLEEVPMEKLANSIITQLSRRDIFIFNIEIYEIKKQPVSFKETKDGILIKNKKYRLDSSVGIIEEEVEEKPIPPTKSQLQVNFQGNDKALRWETYDPDVSAMSFLRQFKLTPKKRYGILQEKEVPTKLNVPGMGLTETMSIAYIVFDDQGQKVQVSSLHFYPELIGLPRDQNNSYPVDPQMPSLR